MLSPSIGGCDFVADPGNSALVQPVFWTPQTDPSALIIQGGPNPDGGLSLRAEDLLRRAVVQRAGAPLRIEVRGQSYDITFGNAGDEQSLGAFVIFDEITPDRLFAIARFWEAMVGKRVPPDPRMTSQRRARARQMLRAVDARHAGATYRAVAEQIFPAHKHDAKTWVESAIREATIRLVRDGLKLVRGGYRTLLRRPRRSR